MTSRSNTPAIVANGSHEVTLNLDVHRPLAASVTLPLLPNESPSCTVLVANIPTFVALQEALEHIVNISSLDTLDAVRVTVSSGSMSSYEVVCRFSSSTIAAKVHAAHHLHRVSTLSSEKLMAYFVDEDSLLSSGGDVWSTLFPYARAASATSRPREDSTERSLEDSAARSGSPRAAGRSASAAPSNLSWRALASNNSASFAGGGSPVVMSAEPFDLTVTAPVSCSICLEALGHAPVIALPCGHCFDVGCFIRVEEGICPLCRFNISECSAQCAVASCGVSHDLWLCLVCGEPHCGRSASDHMRKHFELAPTHRYAMQIGGLRVWDLARDALVHRVVTTVDGGVAGVSQGTGNSGDGAAGLRWSALLDSDDDEDGDGHANAAAAAVLESRIDAIAAAFGSILQDQLAAQHAYYAALSSSRETAALAQLEAAELDHRRQLARDYATYLRDAAEASMHALRDGIVRRRQALKAHRERLDTAETTVDALRTNVAKLREMLAKQQQQQQHGAAAPQVIAPGSTKSVDEIQHLEQRLAELYAQFD